MYGDIETKGVSHNLPNDDAVPLDDRRSNCLWRLASRYAEGLPATSGSIFQLNDLLCRNVLDLAAVVRVLSSDLSLAAQVIRRANEGIPEDEEKQYRLAECAV